MQSPAWYVQRLRAMSWAEVIWRVRSKVRQRWWRRAQGHRGSPPLCGVAKVAPWGVAEELSSDDSIALARQLVNGEVLFYGKPLRLAMQGEYPDWNRDPESAIRAPMTLGTAIDYRNRQTVGNARNIWEVNRHHHLVVLGHAWRCSGEDRYREAAGSSISSWLAECPMAIGINWASALEQGIRLISWYLTARMLNWWRDGKEPVDGILDSIYWHCRFIWEHQSRFSSANNHLIGEMAGLYVASTTWPCWQESATWTRESKRILEREVQIQFHDDGVGREQATHYQCFALQFLILAGLVGEQKGDPFSDEYWLAVSRAIGFLRSIMDASGKAPAFGDGDDGLVYMLSTDAYRNGVRNLVEVDDRFRGGFSPGDVLSEHGRWLLSGFPLPRNYPRAAASRRRAFRSGGYYVLGGEFATANEVMVVLDAGPLGFLSIAAHGHADCLSFVMSLGGKPFLIDPGTYCYHSHPDWRQYFRGSRAHNTVVLDGIDQSESGGPFLWVRRASPSVHVVELDGARQRVGATHDGYMRLDAPATVRRELELDMSQCSLVVKDVVTSAGQHGAERFWHLNPACSVSQLGPHWFRAVSGDMSLDVREDSAVACELLFGAMQPTAGWCSPRFGELLPTSTIASRWDVRNVSRTITHLQWRRD